MTAESERELSQDEKRAALDNDIRQQQKPTLHLFAQREADLPRGRFTAVEKATVVGGVSPPHNYPKGPDWTVDPVGPEPSLGFDVNQMPPTGEAFEVRRSLEAQQVPPSSGSIPSPQGMVPGPVPAPSSDVERTGPSSSNKRNNNE
jgi:hypothetical protein